MLMFDVLGKFNLLDNVNTVDRFGRGNINKTYLAKQKNNENYILQLIDNNVFRKPDEVNKNIDSVINYLRSSSTEFPFDIQVVQSTDNEKCICIDDTYWRCYKLSGNTRLLKKIVNNDMIYEIGKCVGRFHQCTTSFPLKSLHLTLHDLHNVKEKYQILHRYVYKDKVEETVPLFNETQFVFNRKNDIGLIEELLKNKEIPLRLVHNNLHLNNMMFDQDTYKVIALIGFDAAMPGTLLYDFGHAVIHFASSSREDESDLSLVHINQEYFKYFVKGYLEETLNILSDKEYELLTESIRLMALEDGMRYLLDYIDAKTDQVDYQTQNLDKTKNMFKLVTDVETHYQDMKDTIDQIRNIIIMDRKQAL